MRSGPRFYHATTTAPDLLCLRGFIFVSRPPLDSAQPAGQTIERNGRKARVVVLVRD